MAEQVLDLGNGLAIWHVSIEECREQDKNARAMPRQTMERLALTMQTDQRLESLPFCAATKKGIQIVSGHHRFRAARMAGIRELYILLDTTGLTAAQITAKQLAHNSIQGYDDPQILKELFEAIDDVELQLEAYIDTEQLTSQLKKLVVPNITLGIQYRTVMLSFLPYQQEEFEDAVAKIADVLPPDATAAYMLELKLLPAFRTALDRVSKHYDVRALSAILGQMVTIALDKLGLVDPEDFAEWVPLAKVLGSYRVPKSLAEMLEQAIEHVNSNGEDMKYGWQALEFIVADYLAGA